MKYGMILILAFVALGLLLAGCPSNPPATGGNNTTGGTTPPANVTPPANGGTTPPANVTPPANGGTTPPAGNTDLQQIASLFGTTQPTEYQANYNINMQSDSTISTATTIIYLKLANMRYDITAEAQTVSLYFIGNNSYMCAETAGNATCYDMGATGMGEYYRLSADPAGAIRQSIEEEGAESVFDNTYGYTYTFNTATHGGLASNCFRATNTTSTSEICVATNGILTYLHWQDTAADADMTQELTAISYTVPDSVFVLPATPVEMPTY